MAFQDSSEDVRSYYALGQMLKGRSAAQKHLNLVARGTFVLVCALWESYCEDIAIEAAQILIMHAESPDDLPPALSKRIARELREDKHELSPWKLAGDGWRTLTLDRVPVIARQTIFNTPKPAQVDELFERSLGLLNVSGTWTTPPRYPVADIRDALKTFIELRGGIAHGQSPRLVVSKKLVSAFYQAVARLVEETDATIATFLRERTRTNPWLTGHGPADTVAKLSGEAEDGRLGKLPVELRDVRPVRVDLDHTEVSFVEYRDRL